jgi:hypothetical protein
MVKNYKKVVPVNYTARDFNSIKNELTEYARRYYSDTFRDFNEASFGALMLDTVAYVGDMLSFYMDYQANESFVDTSIEYDNVVNHARRLGYKYRGNPTSTGMGTFYVLIPANNLGTPDTDYMPTLKRGSSFSSTNGNLYMLNEDIDIGHANNEIVVARVDDDTGLPTWFAVKAHGQLISGTRALATVSIGEFKKFRRIQIEDDNVAEIISITDSEGHTYHEVDYLSQNVVYKAVKNLNYSGADGEVQHLLKPFVVPRRFVVEQERGSTYIQFGYGSDSELSANSVAEPSTVALNQWGKEHITDESFDPSKLMETDKFGVVPSNTVLSIIYRTNSSGIVNAAVDSIIEVIDPVLRFKNISILSTETIGYIYDNIEITNEEPIIGDVNTATVTELKRRAKDQYARQNRAVTKQDYVSTVYSMPPKFGSILRCNIIRDHNSLKRNLNLYVVSEDSNGDLVRTNDSVKSNLKVWLGKNKMINDTIDILDARILNLSIEFSVLGDVDENRYDIIERCRQNLNSELARLPDVGDPFYITDLQDILKSTLGVTDVIDVVVRQKVGAGYADLNFDVDANTSADGRYISLEEDMIWEIKNLAADIRGVVK